MNTWILLASSGKAIIYEKGKNTYSIVERFVNEQAEKTESEIYSDRSGSARTSYTNNQIALSEHHYHDELDSKFAKNISNFLEKKLNAKEVDNVVIVSNKKFIGNIRDKIPKHLKKNIQKEILKNFYTELPHELNTFLEGH